MWVSKTIFQISEVVETARRYVGGQLSVERGLSVKNTIAALNVIRDRWEKSPGVRTTHCGDRCSSVWRLDERAV
jgi:hypothetical protein